MFNSIPLEMIQNPNSKIASTNSKKKTSSVAEIAENEKATGDRIKTLLKYLLKVGKSQKVHLKFLNCCLDAYIWIMSFWQVVKWRI